MAPEDAGAKELFEKLNSEHRAFELGRTLVLLGRVIGLVTILAFFVGFLIPRFLRRKKPSVRPLYGAALVAAIVIIVGIIGVLTFDWKFVSNLSPDYKAIALFLILAALGTLLLILMAKRTKKSLADFELHSNTISLLPVARRYEAQTQDFTIINENHNPVKIDGIELRHIEKLELPAGKIRFSRSPVLTGPATFEPTNGGSFAFRLRAQKENGIVGVSQLQVSPSTAISMYKENNDFILALRNVEVASGIGSLKIYSPFRLMTSQCQITTPTSREPYKILNEQEGLVEGHRPDEPVCIKFHNFVEYCELVFKGVFKNGENSAIPVLKFDDQRFFHLSTKNVRESEININQMEDEVAEGTISFPKLRKDAITLQGNRRFFKTVPNKFGNLSLSLKPDIVNIRFQGLLSSLKVANDQDTLATAPEQLDNVLSWFQREQATAAFVIGFFIALLGLFLDFIGIIP